MRYNPARLARAILAIRRSFLAEGIAPTLGNMQTYILGNLPRDIPTEDFKQALIIAGTILEQDPRGPKPPFITF